MNLWVVAAATGAGYVAKCFWQKWFFKEREGVSESSVHGQPQTLGDSRTDLASTIGGEDDERHLEGATESSAELVSDIFVAGKAGHYHHRLKKYRYSASRPPNECSFKAMNSIESCLLAQVMLYREHARVEEDVHSSCASASASPCVVTMRPLLVNNGRPVTSRARVDPNEVWLKSEENELEKREELLGSFEQRNWKKNMEKLRHRRRRCSSSATLVSGGLFHSQGAQNGMLLLFIGITIGVLHTISAYKREVDKLNELLKQTQKLVQDLHEEEEVEKKDSSKLKEHSSAGFKLQGTVHTVDKFEAMSKIKAELLAELELLELNVNTYSLNITPNRRLDKVNWEPAGCSSDSDHDVRWSLANDTREESKAVSPQELSLRLHGVIQSRLEAQIMELETALEDSEKRVHSHGFGACIE